MPRGRPKHRQNPERPERAAAGLLARFARALGMPVHDREVEDILHGLNAPATDQNGMVHDRRCGWPLKACTCFRFSERYERISNARPPFDPPPPPPRMEIPLPAPAGKIPWRVILGIPTSATPTIEDVQARWRKLSTFYHPDAGGAKESFEAITQARDAALRELQGRA